MIREARDADLDSLLSVHRSAFGSDEEANLVVDLLADDSAKPTLSLVAMEDEQVVGHILFTRARLTPESKAAVSLLAPLAVRPDLQGRGIGGRLVEAGAQQLERAGVGLIFVLGYPDYYGRHGFKPAGALGLNAPYPILAKNADAWMLRELRPGIVGSLKGTVICADALADPRYWVE